MPLDFSNFYKLSDLFDGLEPIQITDWEGHFEVVGNEMRPNRPIFIQAFPQINLKPNFNYLNCGQGFFIFYSTIGPFFRVGFYHNDPFLSRIKKYLKSTIAYCGPNDVLGYSQIVRDYAYRRYLFIKQYKKKMEFLNDIYISIAVVCNENKYDMQDTHEIAGRFKVFLPQILPNGIPINYILGTNPNNNHNIVVNFPNNLNIEDNIYLP
ncbi:MAG: hypothetical protein ACK4K9_06265 [Bacteroidia bacterium]